MKKFFLSLLKFLWEGAVWVLVVWYRCLKEDIPAPDGDDEFKFALGRFTFSLLSFGAVCVILYSPLLVNVEFWWFGFVAFLVLSEGIYVLMHIPPPAQGKNFQIRLR